MADLPGGSSNWTADLTLLGIGGAMDSDAGIANTCALLEIAEGDRASARFLIDCGHTCGRQLHELGLTWSDIDAALITHSHGDHMDGLEVFGYKCRFIWDRRATVIADAAVLAEVWESLEPKMRWLKRSRTESTRATQEDYFCFRAIGDHALDLVPGRLSVRRVAVPHLPFCNAFGWLLQLAGPAGPLIRWSGDTTFDPEHRLFDDFDPPRGDRIFHECSFTPSYERTVHTHVEELRELPPATREGTVLVHHGRVCESPELVDGMTLGQPLQRFRLWPPEPRAG